MTDLNAVLSGSKRRNWFLDFDSTACKDETLDVLVRMADPTAVAEVEAITNQGMGGEIPFDESLRLRFDCFEAYAEDVERAAHYIATRLDTSLLARYESIQKLGERVMIVSGGFEELIFPSLPLLGIPRSQVYANRFIYDDRGRIVGADPTRLTSRDGGKAAQVEALGIDGFKIVIGDGSNDLAIRKAGHADLFIAYVDHQNRPNVVAEADAVADHFGMPLLT